MSLEIEKARAELLETQVEAQMWALQDSSARAFLVTPDRLRALLELEAAQPKVWTAETIKDAPEGLYYTGSKRDGKVYWWPACNSVLSRFIKHRIEVSKVRRPNVELVFLGPIPQPMDTKGGAL